MRKKSHQKGKNNGDFPITIEKLKQKIQKSMQDNPDLVFQTFDIQGKNVVTFFVSYQVNKKQLDNNILIPLLNSGKQWDAQMLLNELPLGSGMAQENIEELIKKIISGSVGIYVENDNQPVTYFVPEQANRALAKAETESLVLGPQVAFTESLTTNLNLIHWRVNSKKLVTEKFIIGERVPSEVRLVYLESIANQTDIQTMRQRLSDLHVEDVSDSSVLAQYIDDSSSTVFPQFYLTELPDRFCYAVTKGKIGVIVDKSPTTIIAPSTLFSFFESTEDVYLRWNIASFLRALRFLAMFISIIMTPTYVAAVTFHYEVIPTSMLVTLGQARSSVPFPPIAEALLLELLIELLREAGARLPTKVGQTMGIVGGIVPGQAAVDAGLTSNVLIVVIALSALASFTAPSYLMGSTIRAIRFPMIFLSGLLGLIGVMFGICFLVIHLLKITSLGRPYLLPVYPLRLKDLDNSLFRLPFSLSNMRAKSLQLKDNRRYPAKESERKKDIDE